MTQKRESPDDVVKLVLFNRIDHVIGQSLRLYLLRRDLEAVEPALQRIIRGGRNPGFSFRVEEVMQTD